MAGRDARPASGPNKCVCQGQTQLVFQYKANYALRGPAQRERIARAGGFSPIAKKATSRCRSVAARAVATLTVAFGRDRSGRAVGNARRQPWPGARPRRRAARTVAAHDSLQFGEFADHAGRKVGFREMRCSLRQSAQFSIVIPAKAGIQGGKVGAAALDPRLRGGDGGVELLREESRKPLHPLDFVVNAAELGVVDAVFQRFDPVFEADFAVLVPEKAGVGEACAQHALVAGDDRRPAIRGKVVGDKQEMRRRPAVGIKTGKILLNGCASRSAPAL